MTRLAQSGRAVASVDVRFRGKADNICTFWTTGCIPSARSLTPISPSDAIAEPRARLDRLCELNVSQQVRNVASDIFVLDAWARGQKLSVHGWIYSITNGLLRDLDVTVSRPEEL